MHLCRTCAEERSSDCNHTDAERQFTGAWATCELYKALDLGYQVTRIIEVYHYEKWASGDDGLFWEYINAMLKIKQEASGWPDWAKTDEQRAQYLAEYFEHEGIELDKDNITDTGNPGMRSLGKICLNSFWGKLGQRTNMSKKVYVTSAHELYDILCDDSNEVSEINIIKPMLISVKYIKLDEYAEDLANSNCIIASWVTAQARLKLYSYLEELQDRVLYMDTDSVIYLYTDKPLDTGDYLGDMTCELNGSFITEFVSCGPKQYSYITADNKTVCKIRGFTLDSTAANILNFESMKKMMFDWVNNNHSRIDVCRPQIVRKRDHTVVTRPSRKTYSFVYDKCFVIDFVCFPYGFK